MRDDVAWKASSDDKIAKIGHNMAVARRYLDRTTPHHDPIFELPLAKVRWVRHTPDFKAQARRTCGETARAEEIPPGGYDQPSIGLDGERLPSALTQSLLTTCELAATGGVDGATPNRLQGLCPVLRRGSDHRAKPTTMGLAAAGRELLPRQ